MFLQLRDFPPGFVPCLSNRDTTLRSFLMENISEDELQHYLIPERMLLKHSRVYDIRQKSDTSSNCFTKAYSHYAEGTGSVLQENESESLDQRFTRFEEKCDVSELTPLRLRYFTPQEVANLMGFPAQFNFPSSISLKTKYRLLGNSLNVLVVSNLLKLLVN